MKNLAQIKVNSSQLKLIIGENINYPFPTELYYTKVGKPKQRTLTERLSTIIETSDWANKRSHDERFDNKHPVELAVNSIKEKGLSKSMVASIRNNYLCQKKKEIVGKWKILIDVITPEHKLFIEKLLSDTHESKIKTYPNYYLKNGK